MIIKTLNGPVGGSGSTTQRPETVDVLFTNAQGATITLGYAVAITTTAASVDGMLAVLPATSNIKTYYGVALKNTPNNGTGLARCWGLANSVFIFAHGTSVTIAVDVAIGPGPSSLGHGSTGLVDITAPVISLDAAGAAVCSPGGYIRGFVRAM